MTECHLFVREAELDTNKPAPPFAAKAMLAEARQHVEPIWSEDGPTLAFTLIAGNRIYYVTPETSDREVLAAAMPKLIKECGVTRYVVVLEGDATKTEGQPGEDPERVEMLIVGVANILGDKALGCFEIKRDAEGGGSLGAWEELDDFDGWALDLFDNLTVPGSMH